MKVLRMGTLNINGSKDRERRAVTAELSGNKNNDMILYRKHSVLDNEAEGGIGLRGQCFLSYGTNLSVGCSSFIFFILINALMCEVE